MLALRDYQLGVKSKIEVCREFTLRLERLKKIACVESVGDEVVMDKKDLGVYEVDGIRYCKSNKRMLYHPDFHENHGKPWSQSDIAYMVQMRPVMKWADIGLALGRTHSVCAQKYSVLKKDGKLDYYRGLDC